MSLLSFVVKIELICFQLDDYIVLYGLRTLFTFSPVKQCVAQAGRTPKAVKVSGKLVCYI